MHNYEVKPNHYYKKNIDSDFYIELIDGPFQGLCFVFGPIEFAGEDEQGNGIINFDYHLLFIPETVNFEEEKFEIEQMVGNVLQRILETLVEKNSDETGTGDTESTDEGRRLSQEGDTLSEG